MANPYIDTPPVIVENEQVETTEVLDLASGARFVIGVTNTTVAIDECGARHFAQRQVRVRSTDGRVLQPNDQVYACTCGCGTDLLSAHTVRFCEFCQAPLAVGHVRTWDDGATRAGVCTHCYESGRRKRTLKRFFRWLLKLS